MGYIYRRKLKNGELCAVYWIQYYANGRRVQESTGTTKESEAKAILKRKEGRAAEGQPLLPRADKVRYEEAAKDLVTFYETTGKRNMAEAKYRLANLAAFFAGRKIAGIGPQDSTDYAAGRQKEGASAGTVNRELAVLRRMLRLASENGKLYRVPVFRMQKESAPRQGFFEVSQFEAVRARLTPDLQAAVTIAYAYGWRVRSEVFTLRLNQVDLEAGTLRLDPGQTKNDDARVVYLTPELKDTLTAQVERVKAFMRERGSVVPWLFPHLTGRYAGRMRHEFNKAWHKACRLAGCPGMLVHDMRRSAVRNMVNAGVRERVAMQVTGHKTRAIFDRYHIVSPEDLQEASLKIATTLSTTLADSATPEHHVIPLKQRVRGM